MSYYTLPSGNFMVVPCKDGDALVATGFKFAPKEKEAVEDYLKNKVYCQDLPCEIIKDIDDLYQLNADQIPISEFVYGKANEAFFFTYNHRRYLNDNQTICPTSGGYWQVIGTDEQILDRNEDIIGYKDTLIFFWGKAPNSQISNCVIEEYRLNPELNTTLDIKIRDNIENVVLCKVQLQDPATEEPVAGEDDFSGSG